MEWAFENYLLYCIIALVIIAIPFCGLLWIIKKTKNW